MKNYKKLLIATSSYSELSNKIIKKFKQKGLLIKTNHYKKKLNKKNLLILGKDADYIIAGTEIYNKDVLDKLKNLKFIFRLGSGTDNVDLEYLKKKKIGFYKSKTTPEISVAELIIGYILVLLRKINTSDQDLKKSIWNKEMGFTLNGKTIGIIGYGKVGKYLHKILKSFNTEVLINDIKLNKKKSIKLKDLLKKSDIVSLNASLGSTKKILNKSNLNLLKKNCILINTSRPENLDYSYLYKLLKNKRILGAGLDVFDKEPYFGKIKNLKNVILTPHIGAYSKEVRSKMEIEALKKVEKLVF